MTAAVWEQGVPPYPPALLALERPPARVYVMGDPAVLERQAVAIVGARDAGPRSVAFARRLGRAVAGAGGCVVSGLARGVDAAAHEGALDVPDGRTCAVLAGGLDVGAPPRNRTLRDRVAGRGLLLSESAPGVHPDKWMFPRRNRLIAALAHATVVVEAGPESGTRHTVREAQRLDRVVAAVPGPVETAACLGSNRLLQEPGVLVVLEPADAVALLSPRVELTPPPAELTADEAGVWDALADGAADVDAIAARSRVPTIRCLAAVTTLELRGLVECTMAGEVRRL